MCSRCNGHKCCDRIQAAGIMKGQDTALCSCNLGHLGSYSDLSAADNACITSGPILVYKRRKLRNNPSTAVLANVSAKNMPICKGHVYLRRKHYNPVVVCPIEVLENASPDPELSGGHASSPRLENPSLAIEKLGEHGALHKMEHVRSSTSIEICSDDPVLTSSGAIDECLVEQHDSYGKGKGEKSVELHSVDDSCSSSMINMDTHCASLKVEVDENGECSSSEAFVGELMGEDILEKDVCISILKSHGLLSCLMRKNPPSMSEENIASCSGARHSRQCNICGLLGITENMLICDQCEEAFHVPCINPNMRKVSFDEWFCQCCLRKKHKIMKAIPGPRSTIIRGELNFRPATSKAKRSPIALMLEDSEPYTTGVRIGKDFQAVVPCWSGRITEATDVFEESMELDPFHICKSPVLSSEQLHKPKPIISNWLQCRDVIVGAGESDGTVCGKWRRAPLTAIQHDDWDCFSCVLWDPTHADCAVPQELETEEILKQLKYIELLRPRLEAKKQKLVAAETNN